MSANNSIPTLNLDIIPNRTADRTFDISAMFANKKFEGIQHSKISWWDFTVMGMLEKTGLYDLFVVQSIHTETKYLAKVLVKSCNDNDTTTLSEFQIQQEVSALNKIKHQNVIK